MAGRPSRTPRFFAHTDLHEGERLALPEAVSHHALRVLRLAQGDAVVLFDGHGGEYPAQVAEIARSTLIVAVGAHNAVERESLLDVTLLQGISSGERMDLTIQKTIELGVRALRPVHAERSVVRLDAKRVEAKHGHWRRVAISACEQCGRNRLPELHPASTLPEACRDLDPAATRLLLAPDGTVRVRDVVADPQRPVVLAAGPEAGFGPAEEDVLLRAGFVPVRIGSRVLRTETAAPAALAALNALCGEF